MNNQFFDRYGPWALIAGGSEGIGKSFAQQLAAMGINLILLARKDEALQDTASELGQRYPIEIIAQVFDLTEPDLEQRLHAVIGDKDIGLMIYNAGAGDGAHPFLDQHLDYLLKLIRLNCMGPLVLSHVVGKRLRARGRGGIILLSSMGAFYGSAYIAAYAATKAFDLILAEGLWAELRSANIDVLGLIAGATDTPAMYRIDPGFKANTNSSGDNENPGRPTLMHSDDVAREGLEYLDKGPTRIAGESNRTIATIFTQAPREAIIEAMSSASAGLYNKPWPDVYKESVT